MGIPSAPDGSVGGWDRCFETQVLNGYAYCSNGQGFSIVDVRDPRNMRAVFRHANTNPAPDNTQYIDIKDNILVQKRNGSLEMWDVTNPPVAGPPELVHTARHPRVTAAWFTP
jgi:hypothetical protein